MRAISRQSGRLPTPAVETFRTHGGEIVDGERGKEVEDRAKGRQAPIWYPDKKLRFRSDSRLGVDS